jgi:hypothetical protein
MNRGIVTLSGVLQASLPLALEVILDPVHHVNVRWDFQALQYGLRNRSSRCGTWD